MIEKISASVSLIEIDLNENVDIIVWEKWTNTRVYATMEGWRMNEMND